MTPLFAVNLKRRNELSHSSDKSNKRHESQITNHQCHHQHYYRHHHHNHVITGSLADMWVTPVGLKLVQMPGGRKSKQQRVPQSMQVRTKKKWYVPHLTPPHIPHRLVPRYATPFRLAPLCLATNGQSLKFETSAKHGGFRVVPTSNLLAGGGYEVVMEDRREDALVCDALWVRSALICSILCCVVLFWLVLFCAIAIATCVFFVQLGGFFQCKCV